MKFDLTLPTHNTTLNLQILDANTVTTNDHISAVSYSIDDICREAYDQESSIRVKVEGKD